MKTLRRELRQTIFDVLEKYYQDNPPSEEASSHNRDISVIMAYEILELQAFKTDEEKPKYDVSRAGLEWALLGEAGIEQEQIDRNILEKEAQDAFEHDLQLPANWFWYGKGTEDKVLADLRAFVVEQYSKDRKCFQKYQTWRIQPFARGAMSNLAIKRSPENFRASWSDYLASNAMYGKKDDQEPTVDANGVPVSY